MPESSQDNLGAYTLKAGDTLESIAFQVYGDSSLWYLLADANGITDRAAQAGEKNSQLHIGLRINIPPSTKGQHHTSQTHKVLSNADFTGDTSATAYSLIAQPPASPTHTSKAVKIFAAVMVAVTAAVVMVFSAGALASLMGVGAGLSFISTGLAVLGGASGLSLSATLGISFAAGFTSSIAGQGAANLLGQQKGIDLKSALITGLGTAATAGVSSMLNGSTTYTGIRKAMDGASPNAFSITSATEMMERDAVSQSLNLALTRHQHFDWLELGVSSATAGLMGGVKAQQLNSYVHDKIGTASTFLNSELQALATGSITNSHFDAAQILTDNLGNAVSSTIIQAGTTQPEYSPIPEEVEEGGFCPIPTEENYTPIPEGTYERFHQEAALRRRLDEASAKYGSGGALLNSGSVFGVIGDAAYGDGYGLPVGQGALGAESSLLINNHKSSKTYNINYKELLKSNDFKVYLSTINGEAGGQSQDAWIAVGNVINNRVAYREWSRYKTQVAVIENTGFDAYWKKTSHYESAYNSLSSGKLDSHLNKMMHVIAPVYLRLTQDTTNGAVLYYSPKAQAALATRSSQYKKVPEWDWSKLTRTYPMGVKKDDFAFYKYK